MQTSMSPEKIGYVVGVIIGLLIVIGVMAFAVVAIIKAVTKKTTGWIVCAAIFGSLALLFVGIFAVAFIKGFTGALHAGQDASNESTGANQTITGRNVAYSIEVPSNWTIQREKRDFDVLANQGTTYVGVIAEEVSLGSPEVVAKIARQNLSKVGEHIQLTEPTPVVIDGRNWLQFTVTCEVEKLPFYYQYYVYAGKEGTFQIIGWTFQNMKDKSSPRMDAVAKTFAFPK